MKDTSIIPRIFLTQFYATAAICLCVAGAFKWWVAAIIIVGVILLQILPLFLMIFQFGLIPTGCLSACMVVSSIIAGTKEWFVPICIVEIVLYVVYCFLFSTFAPFPQLMKLLHVDEEWYYIPKSHYWPGGW